VKSATLQTSESRGGQEGLPLGPIQSQWSITILDWIGNTGGPGIADSDEALMIFIITVAQPRYNTKSLAPAGACA
jgi:hypothetical protein